MVADHRPPNLKGPQLFVEGSGFASEAVGVLRDLIVPQTWVRRVATKLCGHACVPCE